MTDPEHGQRPFDIGAPADRPSDERASGAPDGGRFEGKHARNAGPDTQTAEASMPRSGGRTARGDGLNGAPTAEVHGRAGDEPASPARSRKRKRRRKPAGQGAVHAAVAPDRTSQPEAAPPGSEGKRRRRGKRQRGPQCRPFAGAPCTSDRGPSRAEASSRKTGDHDRQPIRADIRERDADALHRRGTDGPVEATASAARSGSGPASDRRRAFPIAGSNAPAQPLYAALDLGTNNCRLLIAQPTRPGQFRVVDAFSRIVRLGEGLIGSGRLSDAAMDRAVEALKVCAGKLGGRPIRKRRLIATEACRAAENGAAFLARVRAETGLDLEIVDRETEARLAVSGCASLVEADTRSVVLFDIGGGSSEIAVIDLAGNRTNRLCNHIKAWTSLPVGVVTLSEQHGGREVTREVFAAMVADVEAMLACFDCPKSLTGHHGSDGHGFHLLGTSGTVTTLAGVYLGLPRYDRRRVDGLWLSSGDVDAMRDRLLSWDFDQRSANPCIGADRADLVLAGCAILEAIRRRWPAERMRVADRGLREGLLTDMMAADGVWRRHRRGRRQPWRTAAPA